MKVRVAYIDEPPFYWTEPDGSVTGSDIELAERVLHAIGVTSIEHHLTSFEELLPGVHEGRWDMNVPIFVTAGRAAQVAFSVPVWALGDGFVVHDGNPKTLTSYRAVAQHNDARLGMINGQVQLDSAKSAGVHDGQIVMFKDQAEAIAALLGGKIDAFAGTAVGNRSVAGANKELEAVAHEMSKESEVPVGAFSFNKSNRALLQAVNEQLRKYLGCVDHRARMAKYGLTNAEIDGIVTEET